MRMFVLTPKVGINRGNHGGHGVKAIYVILVIVPGINFATLEPFANANFN